MQVKRTLNQNKRGVQEFNLYQLQNPRHNTPCLSLTLMVAPPSPGSGFGHDNSGDSSGHPLVLIISRGQLLSS